MPDHCLEESNSSRALTSAGTAASIVAIVTASSLESRSCAIVIMRAITRDEEHFLGPQLGAASACRRRIVHSVTTR